MFSQRTANFYQQHGKNDFSLRFLEEGRSIQKLIRHVSVLVVTTCGHQTLLFSTVLFLKKFWNFRREFSTPRLR